MALRRNSSPFSFQSFQGQQPTADQVRVELENAYNYLQQSISGLQFSDIGGQLISDQALFVSDLIESKIIGINDTVTALSESLQSLEAVVVDPTTGLEAAHSRITVQQAVISSLKNSLATQITTVSAVVGTSQASIVTEMDARITADGTITASLTVEVSARISGDATLAASVVTEATARATADGNLSANYSVTVTAGNVVTGMQLNSSTGGGTTQSSIAFQTSVFKIYNGTTGLTMFDVSSSKIRLGATLTVDTANNKLYIGGGTFNDSGTAFYVDSTGQFSLKNQLSWNGTTLTVAGVIGSSGLTAGSGVQQVTVNAGSISLGNTSGSYVALYSDTINNIVGLSIHNSSGTLTNNLFLNTSGGGGSEAGGLNLYNNSGTLTVVLDATSGGAIQSGLFIGSGASLTSLNATNLSSGTVNNARLPSSISVSSLTSSGSTVVGTNLQVSGQSFFANGSAMSPSLCWSSDIDTGWFWNSSGDMRASTNGTTRFVIRDANIVLLVPLKFDSSVVTTGVSQTGYILAVDASGTSIKLLTG